MNTEVWWRLTALGDSAVLLPCALVVLIWLLAVPATRRSGWLWLLAVLADGGVVALTKVLYMGWGLHPPGLDFIGLSGHSAFSFLVWPVALMLVAGRRSPRGSRLAAALGFLLAFFISVSRVAIGAHSVSEALLGGMLGAALALLVMWRQEARLRGQPGRLWVALILLLSLVSGYGHRFPSHSLLSGVALKLSGHTRIYTRADLQVSGHCGAEHAVTEPGRGFPA